jgi:ATP-dependent DNA helicase RecG
VVGTHAVIQDTCDFAKLGLAVIDEQHRFGVAQRLAVARKLQSRDLEPHLLMMSATPIPRTLAMTYLADLDVSTIDELPPGPHTHRHQGLCRQPARGRHRAHPRRGGQRQPGVLGLPADRSLLTRRADEVEGRDSNKRPPLDLQQRHRRPIRS